MACEDCRFEQALDLAISMAEENPNRMFERARQQQKLAELAAVKTIFGKVKPDCPGQDDEGRCGSVSTVNDARHFLMGNPDFHLSANTRSNIGFSHTGEA